MIPYVDRDLIRSFFVAFIMLLIFVQVGYLVSVLLEKNQYVLGDGGQKFGWLMLYYLFSIPRQVSYAIPVGTAACILWVFTVKARNNEVLAYMSGGVSPLRLAMPLLVLAGIFSVLCYLTIEFLAGPGEEASRRIERIQLQERSLETLTREQNVFQRGLGDRFYNIIGFDPATERMEQPVIFQMGDNVRDMRWRLDAHYAERIEEEDGDSYWVFHNAHFRRYAPDGTVTSYNWAEQLREGDEPELQLEEDLTRYLQQRFRPSAMGFNELREYINIFELQGKPTHVLRTYMHVNFSVALGSIVLALLMCGHILRPSSTGVLIGFGGGLAYIFAYYLLVIMGRQMSMAGIVDPLLAAYGPNLLFALMGFYLLRSYRTA